MSELPPEMEEGDDSVNRPPNLKPVQAPNELDDADELDDEDADELVEDDEPFGGAEVEVRGPDDV